MAVEHGFDPERLLTLQVWLPVPNDNAAGRFFRHQQRRGFYERAVAAVQAVPGVRSVALTSRLPLRGPGDTRFTIEGRPVLADQPSPSAEFRMVSPNYFATMGIPFVRGEGLPEVADSLANGKVVVNRTLAEKFWPGEDPIGRRIRLFGPDGPWLSIAGVVGDVRQMGLAQPPRRSSTSPTCVVGPGDVHGGPYRRRSRATGHGSHRAIRQVIRSNRCSASCRWSG
jgi:hypothetical protein